MPTKPKIKSVNDPPTKEEIERYGLEKLELWVTKTEKFRVLSTYYHQLELRNKKC